MFHRWCPQEGESCCSGPRPRAAQTEFAQTELAQAEFAQAEFAQTELAQAELAQAELAQAGESTVALRHRVRLSLVHR